MNRGLRNIGLILIFSGGLLAVVSYLLLKNMPLIALGIGSAILGATALTIPDEIRSSSAIEVMFESSALTMDNVLEEIESLGYPMKEITKKSVALDVEFDEELTGDHGGAIYLPPMNGLIQAFLPLSSSVRDLDTMRKAPSTLLELKDSSRGFIVFPIGAEIPKILNPEDENDLAAALERVLVELSGLCSGVETSESGKIIVVEMENVQFNDNTAKYGKILGTIPTSIAACVISAIHGNPVTIVDEIRAGKKVLVRFKLG